MTTTFKEAMASHKAKHDRLALYRRLEKKTLKKTPEGSRFLYRQTNSLHDLRAFEAIGWELAETTPGYANITRYLLRKPMAQAVLDNA